MYMQETNGLGEFNWSKLIESAVTGYSQYRQADAQADLLKMQMQLANQQAEAQKQALLYSTMNPQYSPVYGAQPQSSNLMPILLIGGATVLLFFLMKD